MQNIFLKELKKQVLKAETDLRNHQRNFTDNGNSLVPMIIEAGSFEEIRVCLGDYKDLPTTDIMNSFEKIIDLLNGWNGSVRNILYDFNFLEVNRKC